MSAQAWFSHDDVSMAPGVPTAVTLRVENVGDRTESYTIIPAGLTAPWTTVTRPNVTLFGGSHDLVEILVRPPAIHSTTAGPTAISVRVVSQADPDDQVVVEMIAMVERFDDRRITTLQPVRRGRRRATFEFLLENHGNSLANCRLHLVDPSGRVDGSFDPPAVGVAPGSSSLVHLNAKAQAGWLRRQERQLDFEIEATEPDHDPASGLATLVQPPTISLRFVARLLMVAVAVGAVVGAWFGVVRPELRDAAERSVDDRIAELAGSATGDDGSEAPPTTVDSTPDTVPVVVTPDPGQVTDAPDGVPIDFRIALDVGVTQERSESISVPDDSSFHLTDLVVQNPNGDLGSAQLLRNGQVLYTFDLGSMASANEFLPRITPLPFGPSDNIVFVVRCDVVGQTSGTGCEIAVLMTGLLYPADTDDS